MVFTPLAQVDVEKKFPVGIALLTFLSPPPVEPPVVKLVNFTGFKHMQLSHGNPATSLASLHGPASLEGDLCSASGTRYHLFAVSLCTAFAALHHHLPAGFIRGFPDPLLL